MKLKGVLILAVAGLLSLVYLTKSPQLEKDNKPYRVQEDNLKQHKEYSSSNLPNTSKAIEGSGEHIKLQKVVDTETDSIDKPQAELKLKNEKIAKLAYSYAISMENANEYNQIINPSIVEKNISMFRDITSPGITDEERYARLEDYAMSGNRLAVLMISSVTQTFESSNLEDIEYRVLRAVASHSQSFEHFEYLITNTESEGQRYTYLLAASKFNQIYGDSKSTKELMDSVIKEHSAKLTEAEITNSKAAAGDLIEKIEDINATEFDGIYQTIEEIYGFPYPAKIVE